MRHPSLYIASVLAVLAAAAVPGWSEEPGRSGVAQDATCLPAGNGNGRGPGAAQPLASGPLGARAATLRVAVEEGRTGGASAELMALKEQALELSDPGSRAELLLHLARTQRELAEASSAERAALLLGAVETLEQAAAAAKQAGDWRLRSYALGYRGELYEQQGQLEAAERLTSQALFDAHRVASLDALYRWHWQLARIQQEQGRPGQALSSYREAVAALDQIRTARASSREKAASFRRSVAPVYQGLTELLLSSAATSGSASELQSLLAEARETEERFRVAELRDYFGDACLDTQRRAFAETVPGTVVVYPIVLEDRIELVVARGDGLKRFVTPIGREELTKEVRALRRFLPQSTTFQYLGPSQRLYDWLIRPLEPVLSEAEVEALVFVPGAPLRTIPFAALHDRETGKFLIERYPLAVTPGLTLTQPRPIDRAGARALVAGISEAVHGYPPLKEVPREVEAVEAVFPGDQLLNEQFQVDRFRHQLESRPYSIVHVASHGEFRADDAQSFLVAYDGEISMDQLADMVSTTRFREELPLELLTLSACKTAVDDDRAALGLAGIALRAGARSAVATLWSVRDDAATQLITEFYTQLGKPGRSRAEALQEAQLHLLRGFTFNHPAHWSPFLLISSWL